jgi:hypothetical protein
MKKIPLLSLFLQFTRLAFKEGYRAIQDYCMTIGKRCGRVNEGWEVLYNRIQLCVEFKSYMTAVYPNHCLTIRKPDFLHSSIQKPSIGKMQRMRNTRAIFTLAFVIVNLVFVNNLNATITVVNSQTNQSTGTSFAITKPTGLAVGHLMIANINQQNSASNLTLPTGWTELAWWNIGSPNRYETIAYKVADANDVAASTFTFTAPSGNLYLAGAITSFSGVNTTATGGIEVTGAVYGVNDAVPIAPPSITTQTNNAMVVFFAAIQPNTITFTANGWKLGGSGGITMTQMYLVNPGTTSTTGIGAAYLVQTTAGSTGAGYEPISASARKGGILLSLKPAGPSCTIPTSTPVTYCQNSTPTSLSVTGATQSGTTISSYTWYSNTSASTSGGTLLATHSSSSVTDTYTPSTATPGSLYYYVSITNSNSETATSVVSSAITVNAPGTWIGSTSTDWNTASNWCGGLPTASTDVIIPAGTTFAPTVGVSGSVCNNITINSGATLTGSSNTLSVSSNWANNGTFNANAGTINFNGTAQSISGSANLFNNLTLSNGGAKTLAAITVNGTLSIQGSCTLTGTTPTYGASAILEYNGSTAQTTSLVEFPVTLAADLTINNASGVTLNGAKVITGNITLTSGNLNANNYNLTVDGNWVNNGGSYVGGTTTVLLTSAAGTIGGTTSTTFPILSIDSGSAYTMNNSNSCTALNFVSSSTASSLIQAPGTTLTVNGTVTLNQPSGNVITAWNINTATATVTGLITFAGSNTTTTRIGKIVLTTGTLNANGGITFVAGAAACHVIDMSGGAGRLNLKGALTAPAASSTLTAGTAGSIFDYVDSNAQTINFFSAGAYNNLWIDNTNASGAALGAILTASNVTGNISVGSVNLGSVFATGNFALTLAASKSITVSSGSTINAGTSLISLGNNGTTTIDGTFITTNSTGALLFGTTGSATINGLFQTANTTGFSGQTTSSIRSTNTPTITLGSNSTIEYNSAVSQAITSRLYSNLSLSNSGNKTITTGTAIANNLSISGSAKAALTSGTSTALTLTLGGANQITGSWGSSSSSATNKNDTWFVTPSNTGIVNVNSGCSVGTWLGTTSNDWNETTNWCSGAVPTSSTAVVIPASGITNWPELSTGETGNCSSLTFNGVASRLNFTGGDLVVAGNVSFSNGIINSSTSASTLSVGGTWTGIGTTFTPGTSLTINFTGTSQTMPTLAYYNLKLSGSGADHLAAVTTVNGSLTLSTGTSLTADQTTNTNLTVGGNLTVGANTTLTISDALGTTPVFTVSGTTTLSGTLNLNHGAKVFTGDVTVNSGGTFTKADALNSAFDFYGSITNNNGTFSIIELGAGTPGAVTFYGSGKTFSGSISVTNAIFNSGATYNNTGIFTVSNYSDGSASPLSGAGSFTNGTDATLKIGGTCTISTLNATATGNTVNYSGAAQAVLNTIYKNLTLSGSGAKTISTTTGTSLASGIVNIDHSTGGTATASVTNTNIGVHELRFTGSTQVAGTWGSNTSTATNQDNTNFTSTSSGYLNTATGAASKLVYTTVPTSGTAGSPFSVTVQSQDANGNPTNPSSNTTITLSKATGSGSLSGVLTGTIATSGNSVTIATPVYSAADIMTLTASATAGMTSLAAVTSGNISFAAGSATTMAVNAGNSQSAISGTAVATSPSVIVKDASNNPVSGITITFAVASGGGSATGLSTTTNSSGIATVGSWTLGTTAGTNTLTATGSGLSGSPVTFTATGTAGALDHFTLILNTPQTNGVAFTGTNTLTAQDGYGNIVTTFSAASDHVTLTPNSPLTGTLSGLSGTNILTGAGDFTSGVANLTTLGLTYTGNSATGTITATSASGKTGTSSSVTITAGSGSIMSVNAGNSQSAISGAAVATSPSVIVKDASNNPVSGITITFAVASGGGSATGLSTTTNSSGIATVGSWTLGTTAGTNTLTATGSGLSGSPVTFTATGTAGTATQLAIQTGNSQSATTGTAVTIDPSVIVKDANNNPVSGITITFAVALGGGSATGLSVTTNSSGIATVGSWTLGTAAGTNTLTATGSGLSGSPVTFTATGTIGSLDHFAISVISSPQTVGTAITGITLTAQDLNDNTVTTFTGTVAFSGTAGVTGTSAAFSGGQLSGVSVTPTAAGTAMTLVVTGSTKTGTTSFTVSPLAPTGSALQNVCSGSTISDLSATGTAIKWYNASTGGSLYSSGTALVDNTHYYASQTVGGSESTTRLNVLVTLTTSGTWLGTTSPGNWSESANWCGGIPTSSTNVIIPASTPYSPVADISSAVCNNLTINSGAVLTIAASQALTVNGVLTNNATATGLVLASNASGTASLIHATNTVAATVERYISGIKEDWHLLSSPVTAQAISGSWLPTGTYGGTGGTGYDLYLWDEPKSCWKYKLNAKWDSLNSGGNNFTVARGYLYSVQATTPTKSFVGNLNNGAQSIALKQSATDVTLKGFNLVGNPYPSSIDWQAAAGWSRSALTASGSGYDMWIWNQTANNYGVCNSYGGSGTNGITQFIPPMQGFFVRASAAGSLGFSNTLRVHDGASTWKSTQLNPMMISAVVQSENDQSYDEARLLFGYPDGLLGTAKLFSPVATAPSLYLASGNENYTVRYLSDTISFPQVPLQFKAGRTGAYKLNFLFDAATFNKVILEDKQTTTMQDLRMDAAYRFSASANDQPNRFVLHLVAMSAATSTELPARITTDGSRIVVDLTQVPGETRVSVYDVLGRKRFEQLLSGESLQSLNFTPGTQLLILKLENPQGNLIRKIVFNSTAQ